MVRLVFSMKFLFLQRIQIQDFEKRNKRIRICMVVLACIVAYVYYIYVFIMHSCESCLKKNTPNQLTAFFFLKITHSLHICFMTFAQ